MKKEELNKMVSTLTGRLIDFDGLVELLGEIRTHYALTYILASMQESQGSGFCTPITTEEAYNELGQLECLIQCLRKSEE